MRISKIHQFSAGFNSGDAISNEMLALKKHFSEIGISGKIYSENIGSSKKSCSKFKNYSERNNDLIIYHHSIHSNILNFILNTNAPKILIYHNVTPHKFFQSYDLKLTYYLKKGREELDRMKNSFFINFGDSKYNCEELEKSGFSNVKELPIVMDFSKFPLKKYMESNEPTLEKKIIFVGRLAPNKKQDDLIRFAKIYKDTFQKKFKLWILGNCSPELKGYKEELGNMIDYYNLKDEVVISDFVSDEMLMKHYSTADLFLSMSEHEGFCVPLIESMFFSVPILAYDSSAVSNTLGNSGILFKKKDFLKISAMADKLIYNKNFKNQIIQNGKKRLADFQNNSSVKIIEQEIRKYFEL